MILYLSGPMTGIPEFNYPAFHEAKKLLNDFGFDVLSPADLPICKSWEWIDYMLEDIDFVFQAEGLAYLPGWTASKSARIERAIADKRGIPCRSFQDWMTL